MIKIPGTEGLSVVEMNFWNPIFSSLTIELSAAILNGLAIPVNWTIKEELIYSWHATDAFGK
ncbi:hypothetical protein IDJ76_07770 [Mucilaginibacter sp. ZB1P21]|uniref:Uncharacterized protein n=1 Tax=Mucilaginibacter glaciei TaxID=2772109 RepID=A0A926NQS4_9SPHI|nr:hypothetical protein [Mucilaginibacter glaciei]